MGSEHAALAAAVDVASVAAASTNMAAPRMSVGIAEKIVAMTTNSFHARAELEVGGRMYEIYRLEALQTRYDVARLPYSLKILLENLLRNEDGEAVRREDI